MKGQAPSLAPFYKRVNALIGQYHDALCVALKVDPDAKKADDDVENDEPEMAQQLHDLAEKYFELALEIGVDEAESIMGDEVSPEINRSCGEDSSGRTRRAALPGSHRARADTRATRCLAG